MAVDQGFGGHSLPTLGAVDPRGAVAMGQEPARHIGCDGVFNLRDLGGYVAQDRRRVRWRVLFRADGLHRVTGHQPALAALGWNTVIDLRTLAEREVSTYSPDAAEGLHFPVLHELWDAEALAEEAHHPVPFLIARYLEMAEHGAEAIAGAIAVLTSPPRLPAVFHCSAGKDRTGVVAALVLSALGVDVGTVAADYHLSAASMDRLVVWINATQPEAAERMARHPKAFRACPPEAMSGFLQQLSHRHGSTEGYLRHIGVTSATLAGLRAALLDGGD
ncbi:MAG: tyrosine-protein phosphatase [Acidimicrobiales bacterium]